jgi:hypothetical protein
LDVGKEMIHNEELSGSSRTVRIHKNYHRMHQNCQDAWKNCQDAAELSECSRAVRMQLNNQYAPEPSGCSRIVGMHRNCKDLKSAKIWGLNISKRTHWTERIYCSVYSTEEPWMLARR